MEEIEQEIVYEWRHWHYKNTTLLILSLILFFAFAEHPLVKDIIHFLGNYGYLSAFLAGVMFVSIFTIAPASVVLFFLAKDLNPMLVSVFAGLGGVVGDYFIFRFLRDRVFTEIKGLFKHNTASFVKHLYKTPHFAWLLPLMGALIIASPVPDELGVGLLGVSKLKNWQFLLLTFLLNSTGIFFVIVLARSL